MKRLIYIVCLLVNINLSCAPPEEDGHEKDPPPQQTVRGLMDWQKDCFLNSVPIGSCWDPCQSPNPPGWCPQKRVAFCGGSEDLEMCGFSLPVVLREDWGITLPGQNQNRMLPSGATLTDTSTPDVIAEAICERIWPPHNQWPTSLFDTNFDVGNLVSTLCGFNWPANELSWSPQIQTPGDIDTIVVHYTATSLSGGETCAEHIRRAVANFHTFERGWGDPGYNFMVCKDTMSQVFEGRWSGTSGVSQWKSIFVQGAHSPPNFGTVGISMVLDANQNPDIDTLEMYKQAVAHIALLADVPISGVVGHLDRNATQCPGNLYNELDAIRDRVAYCRACAGYAD